MHHRHLDTHTLTHTYKIPVYLDAIFYYLFNLEISDGGFKYELVISLMKVENIP